MKTATKSAALFSALAIGVLLAALPVPIIGQQPAGVAAVANNVQLVIEGKVIKVHDGDTVTVLDQENKKFNIRLQGIDAPELKQEFGAASQKNLSAMVLGKHVSIYWNKVDKYRRTVGTIMLDGRDINIEQVKAGVAWHFKKYEDEQSPADRVTYAAAEQAARMAKLGLWKDAAKAVAPGDWRQEVKLKRWGPPPPEGTIIGSANSKKYHRPDCPGYRDMAERNRVFFKSVAEAEAAGFKRAGNCPAEIIATVKTPRPPTTVAAVPSEVKTTVAPSTTASAEVVSSTQAATAVAPTPTTVIKPAVTAEPRQDNSTSALKIIGNKNSKLFHQPWCSGYERVSEKNRVMFETVAEAEAAGYKRAGNCRAEPPAVMSTATTSLSAATSNVEVLGATPAVNSPPIVPLVATPKTDSKPVESDPKVQNAQKIVGNKNSKIFHLPGCSGYDRVSEKNRVYFNNETEAEAAGYRIAKNCSPANPN